MQMNLIEVPRVRQMEYSAKEVRVMTLREVPAVAEQLLCDVPARAVEYWARFVASAPAFNECVETMVALHLNVRRRVISHNIIATGTSDTILCGVKEVFRTAIVANAAAVVLIHNHPSGDACPSEADIRVTRKLIAAGELIGIDVVDHLVIGAGEHRSLRELGYFYK